MKYLRDNISKKYQNILWDLFKKVEDYENEVDTNPHLDIKEIKYYVETELEDDDYYSDDDDE